MSLAIEIVEVGPRDGLQNESAVLSAEDRVEFITRLEAAGVRRVEAVSFVNPKRVPQMAGAEEIMAALPTDLTRSRIGLALNLRGWERAVAAGCDEVNAVVSASEGFGVRNQGAPVAAQLKAMREIAENNAGLPMGPKLSLTISVAFGDPFDGEVPERAVVEIVRRAADAGYQEIALGDTIGAADPWTVRRRVEACREAAPHARLRMHFHDTRKTGLANAFAAVEAGVDVLDASCGGIGGCPFAPRATGNIATEDLVYMLERAGFSTGLDLDALIRTAEWLEGPLGKPVPSGLRRAGRFPSASA
ncbi:MAG: hydroxymethylglutaryl-CoA lyase [Proteobacteria bacterium]|nr:hydroxymethylglutaryl-CoA lyase [Pseudomonadota bacterium]